MLGAPLLGYQLSSDAVAAEAAASLVTITVESVTAIVARRPFTVRQPG